MPHRHRLGSLVLGLLLLLVAPIQAQVDLPEGFFDALEFRHIGPVGNRVIAVTGVPGDLNTYYLGAASGGIFKSTDGGHQWQPIFDDQPASSIGSLAVAPSDPNVVWAGTGETFIRANISIGNGIYRSTDAGKTWHHMGLDETGRIGRVIIHPQNPDVVYAAALGHCYGPQKERGVYRTQDGGKTWEQVLFVSEEAGASDLVMDPNNPRILFAGTWEMHVNTWSRRSGGPGSGLWRSDDGGDNWQRLEGNGLPTGPWGKVGLTMSAADSNRIYALIETSTHRDFAPSDPFQGVLWRSDDGGSKWQMVSADNNLVQRPLYYSRALAAPNDADKVYFMAVRHSTSLDGGKTNEASEPQPGYDHHDMWIDPLLPERRIVGHDGGVSVTTNSGRSWHRPQLPIAQMYHVHVDDQVPYSVYGNRQDGPAMRGPSNTLTGGEIPIGAWQTIGGCEVGFALPTPGNPDRVWTGCYDGILELYDGATRLARTVSVWPEAIESWPGEDLKYRFQWTFPMAISPHDPNKVYVGSQFVHQTTNAGQTWTVISPDLTSNDPELQRRTGGLTLDDAGPTLAPTLFALAESSLEAGLLWSGSNDGLIQLTRDGGETWTDVTTNLPNLPSRGTVSNIEPSPHDAATAYVTVDRHQLGDTATHVYRTKDYGQTWTSLRGDLPQSTFSYAHCVREDPVRPGLLYLGTENAVFVSFDDGKKWHELRSNLPHAPVHWLTVQEHFNDLVVGTYGRGFWILDDLTPLQQLRTEDLEASAVLFEPRPAYRFQTREAAISQPDDPAAGTNPKYGASIHFLLAADSEEEAEGDDEASEPDEDKKRVRLVILDEAGEAVRELSDVPQEPGFHRVFWDLESERSTEIKLRTKPLENPHIQIPDKGWRPLSDGGRLSLLMPPGRYTVRLEVGDSTHTQVLDVLPDPQSPGSSEDLETQMTVLLELYDLVDEAARWINAIEQTRKQFLGLENRLGDQEDLEEVKTAAGELEERLQKFEGEFFDLRLTGAGQDSLRWKRLLYSRMTYLAWGIARSDHRPTDSQMEVFQLYRERMGELRPRFADLQGEVEALADRLAEAGVGAVALQPAP